MLVLETVLAFTVSFRRGRWFSGLVLHHRPQSQQLSGRDGADLFLAPDLPRGNERRGQDCLLFRDAELDRLAHTIITKGTDSFYIGRQNIASEYDPTGPYNFPAWQSHFDASIRSTY